jgi:YegS/Rv2252/BmrU family lipid kinase
VKQKKKILFIINPISGIGRQRIVEKELAQIIDSSLLDYNIIYTEHAKHAIQISKENSTRYNVIVAVGGDGSVNEICQGLIGSECELGIIPAGSGNGFARHMKISLNIKKAIKTILSGTPKLVDTATLNGYRFVNVAGLGFDAHIGNCFAKTKKRGFFSYIRIVLKEFYCYKPLIYKIEVDGTTLERKAFLISIANSTQFGNNAHIAPGAIIDDGYLNLTILKPFPIISAPFIAIRLFNKTLHKSKYVDTLSTKNIVITNESDLFPVHIDGEPICSVNSAKITIKPLSLSVIC